ncbi:MAG TPA: hypothetical protein VEX63_00370 [Flavisolibacter sp.]|nr:hypothetical protein [Flavisolibacter sp.]
MRSQLYFLLLLVSFQYSCQDSGKGKLLPGNTTLPVFHEPDAIEASDSAMQEQSRVIYGALRFGMTKTEVEHLPEEESEALRQIGNRSYRFEPTYSSANQLSRLVIQGLPAKEKDLDTKVKEDVFGLVDMFSMAYGEPVVLTPYPDATRLKAEPLVWNYKWPVDNRVILIGVTKLPSESAYQAICWMYDQQLFQAPGIP